MSTSFTPPLDGGSTIPTAVTTQSPPPYIDTSSPSSSSSIIAVIFIIVSAVIVSASIYLILRLVSKRFHHHRTFSTTNDVVLLRAASTNQHQCRVASNSLLDSLPLFTFRSVTGTKLNGGGGDCAVCLSKFEPHDQLRLLPLCCHAFHADCIDTWIVSNQTCPLCRSTVLSCDSDALDKILPNENRGIRRNSFRVQIGSISRRQGGGAAGEVEGAAQSYSIGSFEYIVDENGYEVSVGSTTHRRGISFDKEIIPVPDPPGEVLAAEVAGGGRSWLREYAGRLRSSGRFFSGSIRRNDPVVAAEDLEANRVGEEISELFRWLSGI
ncbi:hypothetical protein ACJIZ3_007763 [Penstemon smallii]|uniref:RING-type E3 ubiquitin transferase n=1 Tax=Penstemon smallii TaxID=265156 RepID=A0ABD3T7V9_9LAMI